jgi:hypothetical protein
MRCQLLVAFIIAGVTVQALPVVSPNCPDPNDCTGSIQALLNNESVTDLYFPTSNPYVVWPLFLKRSNLRITCDADALILARRYAFNDTGASLLTIANAENITIDGCRLRMWRSDYANPNWYKKGEWRMALNLAAVKNLLLTNSIFEESGGDGIYMGGNCNENVLIQNITSRNNYRQGISVICANGLTVKDSVFEGTRGTNPQCGVDIEPNVPHDMVNNVVFANNTFRDNAGCGISVSVYALSNYTQPFSLQFTNNLVDGTDGYGVIWNIPHAHDPRVTSSVLFDSVTVMNTGKFGVFVFSNNVSYTTPTVFSNFALSNASYSDHDNIANIVFYLEKSNNMIFGPHAEVTDPNDRLLVYAQNPNRTPGWEYNITGAVKVSAPSNRGCMVNTHDVHFNVTCDVPNSGSSSSGSSTATA